MRAAITLDDIDGIDGNTSEGLVVDNYAKGTSGAAINNSVGAGRVQVISNHTDH